MARRRSFSKSPVPTVLVYLGLAVGLVFAGFPILWMFFSSLKSNTEIFSLPPRLLPDEFTLAAYRSIFSDPAKVRFFLNSYLVAGVVTLLTVVDRHPDGLCLQPVHVPAQEPPQRLHHQHADRAADHAADPLLRHGRRLRHLRHLLRADPDLHGLHAALRDPADDRVPQHPAAGAGRGGAGRRRVELDGALAGYRAAVVAGIVATAVYTFLLSWNEFLFALTLTKSMDMRTVPIGISLLMGQHAFEWNEMMAMSVSDRFRSCFSI